MSNDNKDTPLLKPDWNVKAPFLKDAPPKESGSGLFATTVAQTKYGRPLDGVDGQSSSAPRPDEQNIFTGAPKSMAVQEPSVEEHKPNLNWLKKSYFGSK